MRFLIILILFLCGFLLASTSHAQIAYAADGNVIFKAADGGERKVTNIGMDSEPSLSPDGRWIVFVRNYPQLPTSHSDWPRTELWVIHPDGGAAKRIAKDGMVSGRNKNISAIKLPAFLSDSRRIVFHSAWAEVHGSIHLVDMKTGHVRYIIDGNSLDVVRSGEYRDYLIVKLHRYFLAGGTYNWYWLVSLNGKQIDPIGEGEESLAMFLETYADH